MCCYFFFNDTATTEIYTLSLHDALPIWTRPCARSAPMARSTLQKVNATAASSCASAPPTSSSDRKSTRLNSSHANISYAVFCLKKKKNNTICRQEVRSVSLFHHVTYHLP